MLKLLGRIGRTWDADPAIVRLTDDPASADRDRSALLVRTPADARVPGFAAYFWCLAAREAGPPRALAWDVAIPPGMEYLAAGDVVRVVPRTGELAVLYRRASRFNAMLLTERCNSNCVMCSQPPRDVDDRHLAAAYLAAIPLMDPAATAELGITGGEPTLLGHDLLRVIAACRDHLPRTAVHVLSNGRAFNYLSVARDLAAVRHPDLMIGVPLYSDLAHRHDHVVQADGAFDQTVRGLLNLARFGVPVELRVVLHRLTVDRLPQLARFVARNLPFASHVALMGLEMMGHVKMNLDALWVDPADYQDQLAAAVDELARHRMHVSIYNHQLCVLPRPLWPLARKSISDWKNEYLDACQGCGVRQACGGFFASARLRHSDRIGPLPSETIEEPIP